MQEMPPPEVLRLRRDLATAQRRGVGRALLLHLFATLRARGVTSVELKVHADNPAGRRLYEQVGMTVVSG
jgi:ribosomal protein S18 acetylase RimI-like enzyme